MDGERRSRWVRCELLRKSTTREREIIKPQGRIERRGGEKVKKREGNKSRAFFCPLLPADEED